MPGRRRRPLATALVGLLIALALLAAGAVQRANASSKEPAGRPSPECTHPAPRAARGPSNEAVAAPVPDDVPVGVQLVRYPRPDGAGEPWSQWGQGLVLADGRFISAIGDHRGPDGNSYLFAYDPRDQELTRFADILSLVDHKPGDWGYGKIHGQIVAGPCGEAYFSTYWGDRSDDMYTPGYRGDFLFRIDARLTAEPLGVPVEEHGLPSLAAFPRRGLVYGEATDPKAFDERAQEDHGAFFVYDVRRQEVVFNADDDAHIGFRNILVDAKGRAYIATRRGRLLVWEPGSRELKEHDATLPGGGWLRASTSPAPDGSVFGVTKDPDGFFALRPDGSIESLGKARGYTTSLALSPDGSRIFYVPEAHGDAWEQGAPIIAVDTKTGEQQVIVELNDLAEDQLGLTLGGSYNVVLDPSGKRLYVGMNAGHDRDDPWGEVVLAVVTLSS